MRDFTEKFISSAEKGKIPIHVEAMISSLKNSKGELPWNFTLFCTTDKFFSEISQDVYKRQT